MNSAEKSDLSHEALSFVSALRDSVAGGILAIDSEGRIAVVTSGAEQILGVKATATIDRPVTVLQARLQQAITAAQDSPALLSDSVVSIHHKGADTSVQIITVKTGKGGLVVFLSDLTSMHRLEDNVRRLDRLASIGALSASVSHEIKNALVAVRTFVDLLLEKNPDADLASVVRREMGRIDCIVSQMLKFAGPARPAFATVKLHELLDHSLRIVEHEFQGRGLTLKRSFRATDDCVKGDDYQLEQAFVNLFLNAVEAMGPHGTLAVGTESTNLESLENGKTRPHVRVTVNDTGEGIPAESKARIFEPFFTTKNHGTGLGLPITQRIIQEHLGQISLKSEVGKGSTFEILLPVCGRTH
jgi:signal transduction histidine kinase